MHRLGSGLLAALAICRSVTALRVASGSPCEVKCGNTLDHTGSSDMTCSESAYATTSNGVVFQNCVECELTSPYAFRKQTDLQWMLCRLLPHATVPIDRVRPCC